MGIDDGYFVPSAKRVKGERAKTVLVGAVTCETRLQDLFITAITIDGLDGTTRAAELLQTALSLYQVRIAFLDGVTYAGFNVIDPQRLYELFDVPIVVIFRHPLDLNKVYAALRGHFEDYAYRYNVIAHAYTRALKVAAEGTVLGVYALGIPIHEVLNELQRLSLKFVEPKPLRLADRIASLVGKMYSRLLKDA